MLEETPGTVLNRFTHTVVSNGKISVILEAEKAVTYGKKKQTVLKNVHFLEFDDEGSKLTEGWADKVIFFTETENARLTGSIFIYSFQEETAIMAESLSWTKEGRILEADPGDPVMVKKDDGSFVEGKGFKADFRRKRLEFRSGVKGSYVYEED